MAPRKRASSSSTSSSTKKSNHNQQPSQPSKFGIQHFFERHSQSQAAAPSSSAAPRNPNPCPSPNPNPNLPEEDVISQISPEITKSVHLKRFKFSPGMLIKQSQDDGGEEVTWKFSPVNDRLRSFASKQLPGMTKLFSNDSRPGTSTLRPCSENQISSCSVGKLEKWLSSPTITASDKALTSSRMVSIEGTEIWNGIVSSNGLAESKSPFITPPSLPYAPNESISGVVSGDTISDQLDTRPHRKQLLDLLDQVEDAITEESVPDADGGKMRTKNDHIEESVVDTPKEETYCDDKTFLVLEVSEKHKSVTSSCTQNPYKVLRLLDERGGQERALHLCDEWFYSLIAPGDSINVIGEFDEEGKCVIDHNNNLIIIHPDILISGTRVASSFTCPRRAVLDERLKSTEHSTAALIGTLLHQVFQAGLVKDFPTRHFLEEYAGVVLHKNFENLYACGANENDIYSKLIEAIPKLLNWLRDFRKAEGQHQGSKTATVDFGHCEGKKALCISEVVDIEEMAWAPRYGLKGVIDASVHVKMSTSCGDSQETIMPLEFKTGKGTTGQSATEHYAQVILYTILMSERYLKKDIDSGLLYYLHTDQTRGIKVQRSDLVGLIMRRNELATDILKASTSQLLPPMLQSLTMCRGCRHLDSCTVYHKAHGGDSETSGLGELFDNHVNHLTTAHNHFLRHWDRLIDLEAKMSQVLKKEILHSHNIRERRSNSLSPVILDVSNGSSVHGSPKSGRFIYRFVRQKLLHPETEPHTLENMDPSESLPSCPDCTLRCGDRVILSTESGRVAVGNGIICDINHLNVSISFSRHLRLPGSDSSSERSNLIKEVWRVDKDEIVSSFATMRFNLIQLFVQGSRNSHARKMIVDLEAPRFDSGGMFSQDPALSYIRSEKNLNDDQRRAIHKVLTAKDYTLILGMPGTGKTSTMVHAVKALMMRGASVLLTSYTNSAVDNLLIKLKSQGIEFIRIGRQEVVHDDVREHCFSEMEAHSVNDIKDRMERIRVVGATCLGINHPLLANKKFDVCIMDEAGQITLPVSLGPLMLASTFVLVGDHYQLPPLVQSGEARENGMAISLFCRLSEAHPQAISALQCQYRMCAGIMDLSNTLIYGNRLRCGSSDIANAKLELSSGESITLWLKEVLDPNKPVIFITTDQLSTIEAKDQKAANNPVEASIILEITGEIIKRGVPQDEIGIITPYNSQVNLIRRVVGASVEVHTIDKYQGRDKDCILVSFVRSTNNSRGGSSFLLGDWHRINVALTRAKKKLIMVGSLRTLSKVPLLKLLIEKVDEQGGIVHIPDMDIHAKRLLSKCSQLIVK